MTPYWKAASKIVLWRLIVDSSLSVLLVAIGWIVLSLFLFAFKTSLGIPQHYLNLSAILLITIYIGFNLQSAFVRHKRLLSLESTDEQNLYEGGLEDDKSASPSP